MGARLVMPRSMGLRALLAFAMTMPVSVLAATSTAKVQHYVIGSDDDPRVRSAMFEIQQKRYYDAARDLLAIRASVGVSLPGSFNRQLAESLRALGLPDDAPVLRELNKGALPDDAASRQLHLAEAYYNHGDYDRAQAVVEGLNGVLPDALRSRWQDLASRIALRQNRPQVAVDILTKFGSIGDLPTDARYNLAVALLRVGRIKDGLTELNVVGRIDPLTVDMLALRDKANLVLGYWYLKHEQGGTAVTVFKRVRSEGPFSNRALLGLGWAELAVRGEHQRPTDIDSADHPNPYKSLNTLGALIRPGFLDEVIDRDARLRALRSLTMSEPSSAKDAALRRALVPWSILLTRDPMDPAVQECMMAVPYALDQVGAHVEAKQYYERAIAALQETRERLDQAKKNIESGRMVHTIVLRDKDMQAGWDWRMTDLPDALETFYLQHTLADHPYQSTIKDYRDLLFLRDTLTREDQALASLNTSSADRGRGAVPLSYFIKQAQQDKKALAQTGAGKGGALSLQMSSRLGGSALDGASSAPQGATDETSPDLKLAQTPPAFQGDAERAKSLRARIKDVLPQIDIALKAQSDRLKAIAIDELDLQHQTATQYLVQTRFALARLYDTNQEPAADDAAAPKK